MSCNVSSFGKSHNSYSNTPTKLTEFITMSCGTAEQLLNYFYSVAAEQIETFKFQVRYVHSICFL